MTIEEIIDEEVMTRIALRGCIKGLDPFAEHMLKTSEHPLMRFRRTWIRTQAVRQCKEALARQKKLSANLKKIPQPRKSTMWQTASIDPWLHKDMELRHKAEWQDPKFQAYVKREDPDIYPNRELI